MAETDEAGHRPVDRMVAELMATSLLRDDDKVELATHLAEWQAGRLDPEDLRYLMAFHARLVLGVEAAPAVAAQPLREENWRARAERAEAEVVRLRALLEKYGIGDPDQGAEATLAQVGQ